MQITITIEMDENVLEELKNKRTMDKEEIEAISCYAKWFNNTCIGWTKDPEYNRMFLIRQQTYANDKLRANGYLFLNDVYKMLGIDITNAGQLVGWVYDKENPIGDNFVNFGLEMEHNADFINGETADALLDFNVDGCILDRI